MILKEIGNEGRLPLLDSIVNSIFLLIFANGKAVEDAEVDWSKRHKAISLKPINIFPMFYTENKDFFCEFINGEKNSIIADTNAVTVNPLQFFCSMGKWAF